MFGLIFKYWVAFIKPHNFNGNEAKKPSQNVQLKKTCRVVQCKLNFCAKNIKNAYLVVKWPYVGQLDNHRGWATSMPFASVYPMNPKTNWNFGEKILRIGGFEKLFFFFSWLFLNLKQNKKQYAPGCTQKWITLSWRTTNFMDYHPPVAQCLDPCGFASLFLSKMFPKTHMGILTIGMPSTFCIVRHLVSQFLDVPIFVVLQPNY